MSARWSEQQLTEYLGRSASSVPFKLPANEAGAFALGRLPTGKMNRTEAAYDAHLQALHHTGEVLWHKFEGIKLRLADSTFLTVDFPVLPASGVLEMREIKGWMMEDANVKLKVAAAIYPFKFILVRKQKGGGWSHREIG